MMKISLLIFLFYSEIDAARILAVFPTPSISHQLVFRRITEELLRRGHVLTVITTDPINSTDATTTNLKEIDLHELSYDVWKRELIKATFGCPDKFHDQVAVVLRAVRKVFKSQLKVPEVQDIVNKRTGQYDLLLIEAWVRPALIFSHIHKVPVIQISSLAPVDFNSRCFGLPTHPLLYPSTFSTKIFNLSIWEKFQNLYSHLWMNFLLDKEEIEDDKMLQTIFGPNTPSINKLNNNIDMLFVNIHPIWLENIPVPSNTIFIGGIHTKTPKQLPKDLDTYFNSSENGIIYFSLGTNFNTSLLESNKLQIFTKVFSQLPYDVIWKWDKDELPGRSSNIKIHKWLPQADLLYHPKLKVFITQGGLQSTDEAINAGVPLIGIPMLADQWFNVEKYVRHKIGIRLDLENLSEIELKRAILTIINDTSYRDNIIKLRTLINDQPQSPLERAVWWTEYVLRRGGAKHLRAAGANVSWAEYIELELISIITLVIIIIMSVVTMIILALRNVWNSKKSIKIKLK